eukprot:1189571-Prorocentrum_minimum.AAC.1
MKFWETWNSSVVKWLSKGVRATHLRHAVGGPHVVQVIAGHILGLKDLLLRRGGAPGGQGLGTVQAVIDRVGRQGDAHCDHLCSTGLCDLGMFYLTTRALLEHN